MEDFTDSTRKGNGRLGQQAMEVDSTRKGNGRLGQQAMEVDSTRKGNGRLGQQAMEVARLVNVEENDCKFEVQREEHWMHMDLHSL